MHIQLKSDIALAERKVWQEHETRRLVFLASVQHTKQSSLIALLGSWLIIWGHWMQHSSPEAA